MAADFDVVIVGSGFGGAVCAYRLSKAGARVLVLERGRRWGPKSFPRKPEDPWLWDDRRPVACHGWFDFRVFPNMSIVQGAGVGGGSLVYANISVNARKDTFDQGWPEGITFESLVPHYQEVGRMLGIAPVPVAQWPERTRLLREGASRIGFPDRFERLDLAVRFDEGWTYGQADPHDHDHAVMSANAFGIEQGTCVHLGNCVIGCDVNARNTLDLNYLAGAERLHGAEIRSLHIVRHVAPSPDGYEVRYEEIADGSLKPGHVTASKVVLAAGSLGSTEILLRSRQEGLLPLVSERIGHSWSSNGDFLTPALHFLRRPPVEPTRGPTITAAIDLLDGAYRGKDIFIEDGGLPNIGREWLQRRAAEEADDPREERLILSLLPLLSGGRFLQHVMPWFAQARDAADGTLSLKQGRLWLDWDVQASRETMAAVASLHRRLAGLTRGIPVTPIAWSVGQDLITPHPLGGCNMASSVAGGVVGQTGGVFNYPGLYVADGSIVPKAIGLNPSKTIAALAEHIAAGIVAEG